MCLSMYTYDIRYPIPTLSGACRIGLTKVGLGTNRFAVKLIRLEG